MSSSTSDSDDEFLTDRCANSKSNEKYLKFTQDIDLGTLEEKLNELLETIEEKCDLKEEPITPSLSSQHEDEDESDDDIELDENGCVHDFNLIADVLEDKHVGNKTFNDMELREIERKNSILMNKILSHEKRQPQYKATTTSFTKVSNSFVNRKKQQQKINRENMLMLRRIEGVKPFGKSKPNKK